MGVVVRLEEQEVQMVEAVEEGEYHRLVEEVSDVTDLIVMAQVVPMSALV